MARDQNFFKNLFKPSIVRDVEGKSRTAATSLSNNFQESIGPMNVTASFKFDPSGSPLKNTQQLNIDFSKFENHTFFNSAKNKVQVAFEKIINQFPFDGTRSDQEAFFERLSGFEKYIFDIFPTNIGFLMFSGSAAPAGGSYISVLDYQESGSPSFVKTSKGEPVLNFGSGPFSIEFDIYVPSGILNDNEVILQRLQTAEKGFTIALTSSHESSSPLENTNVTCILSDEYKHITSSFNIQKGKFNHVAFVYDRGSSNELKGYLEGDHKDTSKFAQEIGDFNFFDTRLLIGSGTTHTFGTSELVPAQTLSGALDEVRFFHSSRTQAEISNYGKEVIFSQPDLKLYYRFNEPSGTFDKNGVGNSSLTLDYSGNGLHAKVINFDMSLRDTGSIKSSTMIAEDPELSPVLFPSFASVQNLAFDLIAEASQYDSNNPNLITRMIPTHYLSEGSYSDGFEKIDGDLGDAPGMREDIPGGNRIKQSQIISSVLFMWAEVFDEIKMFVDEFGRLLKIDYKNDATINDQFLPFLANYHAYTLPAQFNAASSEQFHRGRKVSREDAYSNLTLQKIQDTMWRRILSDLPQIRRSKGTKNSLKSVLNNMGIDPNGPFRIREYGGSKTKRIEDSYEKRSEIAAMLTFSGTFAPAGTLSGEGIDPNRPLMLTNFLSASRVEPGFPTPVGNNNTRQVHPVTGTDNASDGLLTSGSWTIEGVFKFDGLKEHDNTQSLMRLQTTGSDVDGNANNWLLFNVIAMKRVKATSTTGSVSLLGKPLSGSLDSILNIQIPNVDVMDGQKWNVSFGRERNDRDSTKQYVSSSYFLRVGRVTPGGTLLFHSGASFLYDTSPNPLTFVSSSNNASGAFVAIGSMSLSYDSGVSDISHLNDSTLTNANLVNFSGKASGIRFFSKCLTENETISHVKNFKSLGTEDPLTNFNFVSSTSGSFERLRLDISLDQRVTNSLSDGTLTGFDFSQNNSWGKGTGFEPSKRVIVPERFDYLTFSPKFELSSAENKIRIRSYKSIRKAILNDVEVAPVYEIPPAEIPVDDRRAEITMSSVQALNDDIMIIFSTLDFFDNAIGNPELIFATEYPDLRNMRRIYFNRLDDKVSLEKFFQFFKWFDDSVGDILEELIPRTTRFLGTNFVIENHALERSKFSYSYHDMYLGELDRPSTSMIFLQQFVGKIKKF